MNASSVLVLVERHKLDQWVSEEMQGAHTLEVCGVNAYGYIYACEMPP